MNRFVLTAALLLVMAVPTYAQTPDISGKWEVTIVSQQGTMPPSALDLKKEGDKFVGVFNTPQGIADVQATVKDKTVTFLLPPVQTQQGPVNVSMEGTVEGETMKGFIDVGGRTTLDWSAKRTAAAAGAPQSGEPDAKNDLSGTWGLEVTTAAGTTTPTVMLKQEGEKLSGQYSGQLGEAPITGSVKGGEFTFSFSVTIEGNASTVIFTGKAEKDTMKGTVSLAGMGDGTFAGKKK